MHHKSFALILCAAVACTQVVRAAASDAPKKSATQAAKAKPAEPTKPAEPAKAVETPPAVTPAPPEGNVPKAPAADAPDPDAPLVTVNGKSLTMRMVNWMQPNPQPAVIKSIADFWVTTQLLNEEAIQRKLPDNPKAKYLAELSAMQVYGRELLLQVQETGSVTEAEVSDYYNKNKNTDPRFSEPERFSFAHILVNTADEAKAVLAKIKAGEDMAALARKLSRSSDANTGGAAKLLAASFVRMRYGAEIHDALLAGQEGQLLGPLKTKDGFEVLRHEGKVPARVKPFDTVKDQIRSDLERGKKSAAEEQFTHSLKEKAAPKIQKSELLLQTEKLAQTPGSPAAPGMGPPGAGPVPTPPPPSRSTWQTLPKRESGSHSPPPPSSVPPSSVPPAPGPR